MKERETRTAAANACATSIVTAYRRIWRRWWGGIDYWKLRSEIINAIEFVADETDKSLRQEIRETQNAGIEAVKDASARERERCEALAQRWFQFKDFDLAEAIRIGWTISDLQLIGQNPNDPSARPPPRSEQ